MNRAMAVTPKIRKRREGAGPQGLPGSGKSPGSGESPGATEAADVAGAFAISLDVTAVYDTAYRQASILAVRCVTCPGPGDGAAVTGTMRQGGGSSPVSVRAQLVVVRVV